MLRANQDYPVWKAHMKWKECQSIENYVSLAIPEWQPNHASLGPFFGPSIEVVYLHGWIRPCYLMFICNALLICRAQSFVVWRKQPFTHFILENVMVGHNRTSKVSKQLCYICVYTHNSHIAMKYKTQNERLPETLNGYGVLRMIHLHMFFYLFHIFMPYNTMLYFRLPYFHVSNSVLFST